MRSGIEVAKESGAGIEQVIFLDEDIDLELAQVPGLDEALPIKRQTAVQLWRLSVISNQPIKPSKIVSTRPDLLAHPVDMDFDCLEVYVDGEEMELEDQEPGVNLGEKLGVSRQVGRTYRDVVQCESWRPKVEKIKPRFKLEQMLLDGVDAQPCDMSIGCDSLGPESIGSMSTELTRIEGEIPHESASALCQFRKPFPKVSQPPSPKLDEELEEWDLGLPMQYKLNWAPFSDSMVWTGEESLGVGEEMGAAYEYVPEKINREENANQLITTGGDQTLKSFATNITDSFEASSIHEQLETAATQSVLVGPVKIPELLKFSRFFQDESKVHDLVKSPDGSVRDGLVIAPSDKELELPDLTGIGVVVNTSTKAARMVAKLVPTNATIVEQELGAKDCEFYLGFTKAVKLVDASFATQVNTTGRFMVAQEAEDLSHGLDHLYICIIHQGQIDTSNIGGVDIENVTVAHVVQNRLLRKVCEWIQEHHGLLPGVLPALNADAELLMQKCTINPLCAALVTSEMTAEQFLSISDDQRRELYDGVVLPRVLENLRT